MKPRLLMVGNDAKFFLSHRLPIAQAAKDHGYEVHVATPLGPFVNDVVAHGFIYHEVKLSRSGTNLIREALSLMSFIILFWRIRPDIAHFITIKPVIYGGIAARVSPVHGVVAAIPGLGFVFMAQGFKALVLKRLVGRLYLLALGKSNLTAIFQNPDDRKALTDLGAIETRRSILIRGSGVDLDQYKPTPAPDGIPVVVFAARLLKDKGIMEFVQAARILHSREISARFLICGDVDSGNPTSMTCAEMDALTKEGVVECVGYSANMARTLSQSSIVVLPSYREGLPKVLIEAAACARPVITTDVPGCRDAIEPGITGLLVPVRDAVALADAMQSLIENEKLRSEMGHSGRDLAERAFSIQGVVAAHLEVYAGLEKGSK